MGQERCIRRPLVGTAIAVSTGMLAASMELISFRGLFITALVTAGAAVMLRKTRLSALLVLLTVFSVAACRYVLALPGERSVADPAELTGPSEGYVSGLPRFHIYDSGEEGTSSFTFRLLDPELSEEEIDVLVHHAPRDFSVMIGDRIALAGRIQQKEFPGRNAMEMHVSYEDVRVVDGAEKWSLRRIGELWRQSVTPHLEAGLEGKPEQASVLKALVLGYRQDIPTETIDRFKRTGSMHIFAISGLHVGIVGFLLALVLLVLGVPRDKLGLVLIPILGMYVVSTGMKSSALRALLMAVVFLLAPLFRRKADIPTSVAAAAIILLMFQPLEILSPGFIFSFAVVIFLVMAFSAVPKRWIQGSWIKGYTVSLLITSLAAGAVAIPLSALFFGTFSPIALVGNLAVVPLTFCIVLCGWLSLLLPVASTVFNSAACLFIDLLLGSVRLLDRIPGSSCKVDPPSMLSVLMWYAGLAALFTHCRTRSAKQMAYAVMALGVFLGVLG